VHSWKQHTVSAIVECLLLEDGIQVSKQGFRMFLKQYKEHGAIARNPGSRMVCHLAPAVQRIVEQATEEDDEAMATQLQVRLAGYCVYVPLTTILWDRLLWDGCIMALLTVS